MRITMPVRRRNGMAWGKPTHHYVDATNQRVPGVTAIIEGGLPKPELKGWAVKVTAQYAVDHWDDLAAQPPSERIDAMKGAHRDTAGRAAMRGTEVHALAEHLMHGRAVTVPEEAREQVEACVRFLDEWQAEPLHTERMVLSLAYGYAGSLDVIARVRDGRTLLLDYKTGRNVYGETALQLAAYRYADFMADADGTNVQPMPQVDGCAVVHLPNVGGYTVLPVQADAAAFRAFRYVQGVAELRPAVADLIGAPMEAVAS